MRYWLEAKAFIEPMSVVRMQKQPSGLQVRVVHDGLHHEHTQVLTPELRVDKDIADPSEGRVVGDYSSESYLQTIDYSIDPDA